MSNLRGENCIGHVVCVPFPSQGHINPMLKLAKFLHRKGFCITFVNTEYNHQRLLKSRGPHSLNGLPTFQFQTIPDGLPPSTNADSTQDVPSLCDSTRKTCLAPFRDLLSKLNQSSSLKNNIPAVTCIISDLIMSFTLEAAQELSIPNVLYWTASACGFMAYSHFRPLVEKGFAPLKDASYLTNGFLNTVIDWVPGMEGLCLKDFPSFIRTVDPEDVILDFVMDQLERSLMASAVIFNTFDDLEHRVLKHLSSILPNPIFTIGPLHLLYPDDNNQVQENGLNNIRTNLWKEQPGCLEWLDSKEPESVVYVNFGSVTVMTPQQLVEFAWGLANSKKFFLWVIRPDIVNGELAIVPPEFLEDTKERGLLASWSPQEEVLRHPSIGGFLTHNGWNSTLESLCHGVPMLCWPFFAEQQTNCWFCCNKLGIGIEMENDAKRNEIEAIVKELMDGERGKELKKKAMEWKIMAEKAIASPNGSSYVNLDRMINEVILGKIN